ncbi:MAG: hypothetical protein PHN77_20410, partial [Thermoguttaceae bacterium]|nr:hypothetical protein [Thermoguttaceae bacterium]
LGKSALDIRWIVADHPFAEGRCVAQAIQNGAKLEGHGANGPRTPNDPKAPARSDGLPTVLMLRFPALPGDGC